MRYGSRSLGYILLLFIAIAWITLQFSGEFREKVSSIRQGRSFKPLPVCDPFALPGRIEIDQQVEENNYWLPYDRSCPPRNPIPAIKEGREFNPLYGKIVVMLGDSIDRNNVRYTCRAAGEVLQITSLSSPFNNSNIFTEGSPHLNVYPHLCYFQKYDMVLVNFFMCGLQTNWEKAWQEKCPQPLRFEDRIKQTVKPYLDILYGEQRPIKENPPIFYLSSFLWDLNLFTNEDEEDNVSIETPISSERISWWDNRMTTVLQTLKETYPDSPIIWRQGHASEQKHQQPSVRIRQLLNYNKYFATKNNLPINNWGDLIDGYMQMNYTFDYLHPKYLPMGYLWAQMFFTDLIERL